MNIVVFFEPTRALLIHVRLVASSVHNNILQVQNFGCLKAKSKVSNQFFRIIGVNSSLMMS